MTKISHVSCVKFSTNFIIKMCLIFPLGFHSFDSRVQELWAIEVDKLSILAIIIIGKPEAPESRGPFT